MTLRWAVFRIADLRWLTSARFSSIIGDLALPVAVTFLILRRLNGGPAAVGIAIGAELTGTLVFLVLGGAWADRLRPIPIMIGADIARAFIQITIVVLYAANLLGILVLVALLLLRGVGTAFFNPASQVLRIHILDGDTLQAGNAALGLAGSIAAIVGPLVGGAIVVMVGPVYAIALDAATFAASALLISRMRVRRSAVCSSNGTTPQSHQRVLRMIRVGLSEVLARPWLSMFFGSFLIVHFVGAGPLQTLMPIVANRDYGGPIAYSAMISAIGVGSVLGGLAAMHLRIVHRLRWTALLLLPTCLAPGLMAMRAPLIAVLISFGVMGLAGAAQGVVWSVVMQAAVPPKMLGRVSSIDSITSLVSLPAGQALGGILAGVVGVSPMLWSATIGIALPPLLILLLGGARREPVPTDANTNG